MEYEPRDQADGVYAHIECFAVWLAESRLLERWPPVKMAADPPPTSFEQAV